MSKYLYGAAVQGIQDFIFKTNELKHIIGASELVEQICTTVFDKLIEDCGIKTGESVVRAAGNIKFIFENEDDCKKVVREFPKRVMTMAPGVTISQAVVLMENDFGKAIDDIEALLKVQRNKPTRSVTTGLVGVKRANNTGLPVVKVEGFKDESTVQKELFQNVKGLCEKSFGKDAISAKNVAYNVSDITDKNDWIAVIHADGNGLGKVVQVVGKQKDVFRDFSQKLDTATKEAANIAFEAVADKFTEKKIIPIRPVVLSGDDMTVIIRGDLALDYANAFITAFEETTKKHLGDILKEQHVFADDKDYLTACAGIAFIKSSYPFYYGYQLAEDLCGQAKKDTKAIYGAETNYLPPSCLMFHKVQDSFIVDYKDIVVRELTSKDGLSFKAGPYYIHPQNSKNTVEDLIQASLLLNSENGDGIKSGIRNWISLRIEDKNKAGQRKNRMLQIFIDDKAVEALTNEKDNRCMAYDVLAYNTIINQQTK
ncbi:MAG: hypothetical protein J6I31_03110 [Prevotella sp.]|nr:hypothetical protein [Prevotella sp.]